MRDARVSNASEARASVDAVSRALVVTGDEASRAHWERAFASTATEPRPANVIAERGRKGNFLGALQAYRRTVAVEFGPNEDPGYDQMVMLGGSGTRLSPLTQSLRNMKAALLLPSSDGDQAALTVGEAAIRSSAPWIRVLRDGGFHGIVMRWGDEILIPSSALTVGPSDYADVDVVRYGYSARPNELLATQKEWLLCDDDNNVYAEVPRQSLDRLLLAVSQFSTETSLHVNLGSFAASHEFMASFTEAFDDLLDDDTVAANWDPYLWIALHSGSHEEWEKSCRAGRTDAPRDFVALRTGIPDFWRRVQRAKSTLARRTGRNFSAKLLDFGEPYWFDAGNHASLRKGLTDIFAPGRDGDTIRALLGLPTDLSTGSSLISGSEVSAGAHVRNSIVIGSSIEGPDSYMDRAIVINCRAGSLRIDPGGVVMECNVETLTVDGPHGFALRLAGRGHVSGNEVTAAIGPPQFGLRMSYFNIDSIMNDESFERRQWANPISFKEAAAIAKWDGKPDLTGF